MGIADAILDLVSSGTTLRENCLKEIEGGTVLESQVCDAFQGWPSDTAYVSKTLNLFILCLLRSMKNLCD